jgi:putative transposase
MSYGIYTVGHCECRASSWIPPIPVRETTVNHLPITSVLNLYLKLAPATLHLERRRHCCVFSLAVVIWLMILQRLQDKGTLTAAVQHVIRGLPPTLNPRTNNRQRKHRVSSNTGGYNRARQKLPFEIVRTMSDQIFEQLLSPETGLRMFLLDGTTLTMQCTPSLREAYPPSRNQNGESHWPILRLLVAHDLNSGIALRPEWGPAGGPKTVSEQRLAEPLIQRLPIGAGILGDQNFGVFSIAWAAQQTGHPVLLRVTEARAKRTFGSAFNNGTDLKMEWNPSRTERERHPELPSDASVRGRLIIRKVYPSDGSKPIRLYLFTTLNLSAKEIVQIYTQRWNIETDLRSIKKTIHLETLDCQTPEMVAKELTLAITAYNLVRAVINESARRTGMNPRQYSFSRVLDMINVWIPHLACISSDADREAEYERLIEYAGECKLYKRKKSASYPRAVWYRRRTFPPRKAETRESDLPRKEKSSSTSSNANNMRH